MKTGGKLMCLIVLMCAVFYGIPLLIYRVNYLGPTLRVHGEIRPVRDQGDWWQYPEETEERGAGDCEDMAILLISRLERRGIPARLGLVNQNGTGHAVVITPKYILDPAFAQVFNRGDYKKQFTFTIDYAAIQRTIRAQRK